jgi:hypothetical protein
VGWGEVGSACEDPEKRRLEVAAARAGRWRRVGRTDTSVHAGLRLRGSPIKGQGSRRARHLGSCIGDHPTGAQGSQPVEPTKVLESTLMISEASRLSLRITNRSTAGSQNSDFNFKNQYF